MNITYYHFADIFLSYIYYNIIIIIIIVIINELNFSAAFNMTLYVHGSIIHTQGISRMRIKNIAWGNFHENVLITLSSQKLARVRVIRLALCRDRAERSMY